MEQDGVHAHAELVGGQFVAEVVGEALQERLSLGVSSAVFPKLSGYCHFFGEKCSTKRLATVGERKERPACVSTTASFILAKEVHGDAHGSTGQLRPRGTHAFENAEAAWLRHVADDPDRAVGTDADVLGLAVYFYPSAAIVLENIVAAVDDSRVALRVHSDAHGSAARFRPSALAVRL